MSNESTNNEVPPSSESNSDSKMVENPHRSPNAKPEEIESSQHQSFRLTAGSEIPDESVPIGTFREAIDYALFLQVPLLLLAILLPIDRFFQHVAVSSVAFWLMTLIIFVRRGGSIPDSDILIVKWGYLPLLLATCILWRLGLTIL